MHLCLRDVGLLVRAAALYLLSCIGSGQRKMKVMPHEFLRLGSQSNGVIAKAAAANVQAMVRT
jgi:hypothetical protein